MSDSTLATTLFIGVVATLAIVIWWLTKKIVETNMGVGK